MTFLTLPADLTDVAVRLTAAAILGAAVGLERDIHGRSAGLRTQLLVSVGSALFMLVSLTLSQVGEPPHDPGRVAAQIVTGIGFLGAGVILKQGVTVRGLTTAACLWVTASIGMAAGGGMFGVAVLTCVMTILTLVGLKYFERSMARDTYRRLTVATRQDLELSRIPDIIRKSGVKVIACELDKNVLTGVLTARVDVRVFHHGTTEIFAERILEALRTEGIEVDHFAWHH